LRGKIDFVNLFQIKVMIAPVYPKQDPEYRKIVMERFYKLVRETNWNDTCGEYQGKPRGRKAKFIERPKAKARPGERYSWLD
jgi:hypothetical protein